MKITVFGASGRTGIKIVEQALERGLEVKGFARDPDKLTIKNPKLEVVKGDILDKSAVDKAAEGVDVALLALGSRQPVLAEGTKHIIDAMKKHGVKRIVVESSYPMSGSAQGLTFMRAKGMSDEQLTAFQPILNDKSGQEKKTRESGLEWVIVRPLTLTDGEKTGQYRAGENLEIKLEDHISRADVADFMLKQVTDDKWLGKTVTLSC